jgi:phospholipase/carboxylesterase
MLGAGGRFCGNFGAMSLSPIEIETAPNPTATVIVMHGLGADGNDFVPIANEMDLSSVGPVRFVFPNAPVIPVTLNGGYRMPAWYDILGLGTDLARPEDEAGLRRSQAAIEALIAHEKARGIPASRIVVAGYLPLAEATAAERHAANQHTPIFQAHGLRDAMVPIARGMQSRDTLQALGYEIEWHEYPMEHSVCAEEIADLNRFLLRVLG